MNRPQEVSVLSPLTAGVLSDKQPSVVCPLWRQQLITEISNSDTIPCNLRLAACAVRRFYGTVYQLLQEQDNILWYKDCFMVPVMCVFFHFCVFVVTSAQFPTCLLALVTSLLSLHSCVASITPSLFLVFFSNLSSFRPARSCCVSLRLGPPWLIQS